MSTVMEFLETNLALLVLLYAVSNLAVMGLQSKMDKD